MIQCSPESRERAPGGTMSRLLSPLRHVVQRDNYRGEDVPLSDQKRPMLPSPKVTAFNQIFIGKLVSHLVTFAAK